MSLAPVVDFGVGLPLERPLDELVATASHAEQLGYAFLWANDDRLQRDVFAVLSAIATRTQRIRLGPGVTNPYTRHPALIAAAIATIDELSAGRAVLGLGAGGTSHGMLGIERTAPVLALREATEVIRALLNGSEVSVEGRVIRAQGARLDFDPQRGNIPIFIGARGPRSLELAGEVADGVIVGNVATIEGWRYAVRHVSAGADRAGRRADAVRFVAWLYCSIADDAAAAVEAVRPMVATSLATSRPILPQLGIEMPPRFAEIMEEQGWNLAREAVERAAPAVPDDVVHRFALAGAPTECARRLRELVAAFPQISQVAIVPLPIGEQRLVDVVDRFMEEVAPSVARTAASDAAASTPPR